MGRLRELEYEGHTYYMGELSDKIRAKDEGLRI